MLNILFIGDIVGKIGRNTISKVLPKIIKQYHPDIIIANAENTAHGSGVTERTLTELESYGIDFFTVGDHAFSKVKQIDLFDQFPIIRPANFSPDAPGKGYEIIEKGKHKILLISLVGRVFMRMDHECPFNKIDEILANKLLQNQKFSAIILEVHAETTAEKICLAKYLDGKVSAIVGTHTHVMTADHKISNAGTAYITDIGMTGFNEGSLGVKIDKLIETFKTQIKYPHEFAEKGKCILNSVLITVNTKNQKAKSIKPITKYIEIK